MEHKIAVVGLGYVGLPLAVELGKKQPVIGFDISKERIEELQNGHDRTDEVEPEDLKNSQVNFSDNPEILKTCNFIIVAVPTPIDDAHQPNLKPIYGASVTIGQNLSRVPLSVMNRQSIRE